MTRAEPFPIVIVRNGCEQSAHHLGIGDRIAYREFDTDRGCYVFTVLTEVPASAEVLAEGWNCEQRGHKYWHPNGVPSSECVECGGSDG